MALSAPPGGVSRVDSAIGPGIRQGLLEALTGPLRGGSRVPFGHIGTPPPRQGCPPYARGTSRAWELHTIALPSSRFGQAAGQRGEPPYSP